MYGTWVFRYIFKIMHKVFKIFSFLFLFGTLTVLSTSCDTVYDEEADCRSLYRVNFVYDLNLKWANAFPSEVHSVNLYIFDENGIFVREFSESGDRLSAPGFCFEFDNETIKPGKYTLLAWCCNDNTRDSSVYDIPSPEPGVTSIEDMTCYLNTYSDNRFHEYSKSQLPFLYHGLAEVEFPDSQQGLTYDYTLYLTKDTNHIRIVLQELSGEDIDASQFEMKIEAANGRLAYDNQLLPINPTIAYLPWSLTSDIMAVGDNGSLVYNYGVIGDLSTLRMMASMQEEFFLTITKKDTGEEIIANIPVIQYALLAKDYYEQAYGHRMSDQEFLDREDEYVMTFFIYNGKWLDSSILINSWRVVLHDYDVS